MAESSSKPRKKGAKTVVREYFDGLAAQNLDRALAVWKPGSLDELHGVETMVAPEGIRGYFESLFAAFGDFAFEVVDIAGSGELAAVRWRAPATFSGPGRFQGMTPNGASVVFEGCDMFRVVDELIVANHAYVNVAYLMQQLGVLPPSGSTVERAMTGAFNAKTAAVDALGKLRGR